MMPSQGYLCDILDFFFNQAQLLIDAIFTLGGLLPNTPPNLTDYVASMFGCNF